MLETANKLRLFSTALYKAECKFDGLYTFYLWCTCPCFISDGGDTVSQGLQSCFSDLITGQIEAGQTSEGPQHREEVLQTLVT